MAKPPILVRAEKCPGEVIDVVISFADYLAQRSDSVQSYAVTVDAGITCPSSSITNGVATIFISGGTALAKYEGKIAVTTTGGRVRHGHFEIKVLED